MEYVAVGSRKRTVYASPLKALCALIIMCFSLASCSITQEDTSHDASVIEQERARCQNIVHISQAILNTGDLQPATRDAVTAAEQNARKHLTALGVSLVTPTPLATVTDEPGRIYTPDQLMTALTSAQSDAFLAAIDTQTSPQLAQLLASIGTSQLLSAQNIAASHKTTQPSITVPSSQIQDASDAWVPLIAAQDQAGYAEEVAAAHLKDKERSRAYDSSVAHRRDAETIAVATKTNGTAQDPRRATYDAPSVNNAADARDLCARVENSLTTQYASLIVKDPTFETRSIAVNAMASTAQNAVSWGYDAKAFPGLNDE